MWIYRVESEDAIGPYTELDYWSNIGDRLIQDHTDAHKHPSPNGDCIPMGFCGTASKINLWNWFSGHLPRLIRHGFKVMKYYVPLKNVHFGIKGWQVTVRDEDMPEPEEGIDITKEFAPWLTTCTSTETSLSVSAI